MSPVQGKSVASTKTKRDGECRPEEIDVWE